MITIVIVKCMNDITCTPTIHNIHNIVYSSSVVLKLKLILRWNRHTYVFLLFVNVGIHVFN